MKLMSLQATASPFCEGHMSETSLLEGFPSPFWINKTRERTKRTIKRLSDGIMKHGKKY